MRRCPECLARALTQTIVRVKENKRFEIVGKELYCTSRSCDYQEELK